MAQAEKSTQNDAPGIIDGVVVVILGLILITVIIILIICCCYKKKDKYAAVHPDGESTPQSDASSTSADKDSDSKSKTAPKMIVVESSFNMNSNVKPVQAFPIPKDKKPAPDSKPRTEHQQKSSGPKPTEKEREAAILEKNDDDVEKEWANCFPFVEVDLSTGRIEILEPISSVKSKSAMKPESNFVSRQMGTSPKGLENVSKQSGLSLEEHTNCTDAEKRSDHCGMDLSTGRYHWVPKVLHGKRYSNI